MQPNRRTTSAARQAHHDWPAIAAAREALAAAEWPVEAHPMLPGETVEVSDGRGGWRKVRNPTRRSVVLVIDARGRKRVAMVLADDVVDQFPDGPAANYLLNAIELLPELLAEAEQLRARVAKLEGR